MSHATTCEMKKHGKPSATVWIGSAQLISLSIFRFGIAQWVKMPLLTGLQKVTALLLGQVSDVPRKGTYGPISGSKGRLFLAGKHKQTDLCLSANINSIEETGAVKQPKRRQQDRGCHDTKTNCFAHLL